MSHRRTAGLRPSLDDLTEGDHVAWVIDSDERFNVQTQRFFDAGRARGNKLFLFGPHPIPSCDDDVTTFDPYLQVLHDGDRALDTMFDMFREQASHAAADGYSGIRVVADMAWTRPLPMTPDDLLIFEAGLDRVVDDIGATVVCAYRPATFHRSSIEAAVAVHPLEVGGGAWDPGFRFWACGPNRWVLSGEVDSHNAGPFSRALESATASEGDVRIVAEGLSFIDVAGLRAIAKAARARPAVRFTIHGVGDAFRRCWSLLSFEQIDNVRLVP